MVAMHRLLTMSLALSFPLVISAADLPDKQWPQFRGPGSTGVADDPSLPDKWSQTENVAWKIAIPGVGWSSPIIWGDRIFITSVISSADAEKPKKGLYFGGERKPPTDEHRWMVYAVDFKTGKIVWEREADRGVPGPKHLKNSYASETPVTDGERVYVYFGNVGLYCYDFSGKLLWSQKAKPVATRYGWGTAASPVLDHDRLYIVNDNDDHSYLQSLDAKTGKIIWSVDRDEKTNWATPYIWSHDGRKEIVTPGTGRVRSYDLDGKLLWEFGGMSSISIPTPFSSHGLLYISSGYVLDQIRPVYAVKPGAHGDISLAKGETSNSAIAWYQPQGGPYNPSPLVYGDYYYTLFDQGFLTCHDAATGKLIYGKQRMDKDAGAFTASPWAANGKLFLLSEDGDTFVVQAGAEYKLIGKNSLDEMSMATPAIARGSLVIRTASNLYRIAKER
jgi:outer membrane protein assembly factor BamB